MRHHHLMNEIADQMVFDYLRQVGDVAHGRLRSDERLDFMTRLRTRIDEMRAETGAVEPAQVRKIIARFGDPLRLVEREHARLERERTADQPAPLENGRVAADEPAPDSEPATQPIPAVPDSARSSPQPSRPESQRPAQPTPWAARTRPSVAPTDQPAGATAAPADGSANGVSRSRGSGGTARPRYEGPPRYEERGRAVPGMPGLGEAMRPIDLRTLVSEHRLETAAIAFLGLGALIPFPFLFTLGAFLVGVVCLAMARAWPARDKLIALVAPPGATVLGVFVVGSVTRGEHVAVDVAAYVAALTGYGATFVRVGALAGAGYLAVQLLRRSVRPPAQR